MEPVTGSVVCFAVRHATAGYLALPLLTALPDKQDRQIAPPEYDGGQKMFKIIFCVEIYFCVPY
jgi:hypothetical protein